jgi:hypothetical protein
MSKGPKISPRVKKIIYEAALDDSKKDRRLLAVELQEKLNKLDIRAIPAEETLQKMISWARNNSNDPQDEPWCLASLSKYPLPLEAIPIILQVQHNVQSHRSPESVAEPKAGQPVTGPFTIREAQWVARLKFIEDIETLEHWAHAYAIGERVSDIIGRNFDSSEMDKAILKDIPPVQQKGGKSK